MKSTFLCIEGGDGAGKSTLIQKIESHFKSQKIDFISTREPGGTPLADEIRDILLKPRTTVVDPRCELFLYEASRVQHVEEKIKPALSKGTTVLCDRFVHSTLAYQGYARGLDLEKIKNINDWATSGLLPDLVIWLKLEPKQALERLNERAKKDSSSHSRLDMEKKSFHEKVYAGFLKLSEQEKNRFIVLDAAKSPNEVFQELLDSPLWKKFFGDKAK